MFPIEDDMKEAVEWINNHAKELSFNDQIKLAKKEYRISGYSIRVIQKTQ